MLEGKSSNCQEILRGIFKKPGVAGMKGGKTSKAGVNLGKKGWENPAPPSPNLLVKKSLH